MNKRSSRHRVVRHAAAWAALALLPTANASPPPPPLSAAPVVRLEYDAEGNPRRTVVAPEAAGLGLATERVYDSLHRWREAIDAQQGRARFDFNGRDDLLRVTDPRQLVTQYGRDGHGHLTQLFSPDTGFSTATRDAAGNLRASTDSRGATAHHDYDALHRLTLSSFSLPGGASLQFRRFYDQQGGFFTHGRGRLTSASFPAGNAFLAYDALGRVNRTAQSLGEQPRHSLQVGYERDAAGNLIRLTYPSGRVLSIGHINGAPDHLGLAPAVGGEILPLVSQIQSDTGLDGALVLRSWLWHLNGNTQAHERRFDAFGRLIRHALGGALRDIHYDAADRIVAFVHLDASGAATPAASALDQHFQYDRLSRLTAVTMGTGTWTFAYDANGNRIQTQNPSPAGTQTRDLTPGADSNRLLAISNPARSFTYDPAGNLLQDQEQPVSRSATYDAVGQLVRMRSTQDGLKYTTVEFAYNHQRQRVLKRTVSIEDCQPSGNPDLRFCSSRPIAAAGTQFVYDLEGRLLGEYNEWGGTPLREYIWLGDTPMAVIEGTGTMPAIYYLYTDHLDTPRVAIDREGRQRWSWVAEPFGNALPNDNPLGFGSVSIHLRMPGQYFDDETGLFYNWHRYYESALGRYTQSDPIGLAGGINTYAYVDGNPISYFDPMGLYRDGRLAMADRVAGVPSSSAPGWGGTRGADMTLRAGFGPAVTVKINSRTGLKYLGVGVGAGLSCTVTGAGIESASDGGGKGFTGDLGMSMGTGLLGINTNISTSLDGGSTTKIAPGFGVGTSGTITFGWRW